MTDGGYRSGPPTPDEELARRAAEGQRRILEARAIQNARPAVSEKDRERNIRIALGAHDSGPLLRIVAVALIVTGALSLAAVAFFDLEVVAWGVLGLFAGPLLQVWAPRATRARVRAEEAWVQSLPFAMTGYFEVLGDRPALGMTLVVSIAWRDASAPDEGTLQGLLGTLDTAARVVSRDATTACVRSGGISGRTGIKSPGVVTQRNTRLVGYVHRLVDEVLLPLDRSSRLERVSLSRE